MIKLIFYPSIVVINLPDHDNRGGIDLIISAWIIESKLVRAAFDVFSSKYFTSSFVNIHPLCSRFDNRANINLIISPRTYSKYFGLPWLYFYPSIAVINIHFWTGTDHNNRAGIDLIISARKIESKWFGLHLTCFHLHISLHPS